MSTPVLLHTDKEPHPVHSRMAESIGAATVQASDSGPIRRLANAATSSYPGPVLLEGGGPLVEGAALKLLRRCGGPVIMLAADETLFNQSTRLTYYTRAETAAHRASIGCIGGVVALSRRLAVISRIRFGLPTAETRPFILSDLHKKLDSLDPVPNAERVVCVAENRPAFAQQSLAGACAELGVPVTFIGEGTEELPGGLGRVDEDRMLHELERAGLSVTPAVAGAYPVAPLEAMASGTPAVVTTTAGTSECLPQQQLAAAPSRDGLVEAMKYYLELSTTRRQELGHMAKQAAEKHREAPMLNNFEEAYREVLSKA